MSIINAQFNEWLYITLSSMNNIEVICIIYTIILTLKWLIKKASKLQCAYFNLFINHRQHFANRIVFDLNKTCWLIANILLNLLKNKLPEAVPTWRWRVSSRKVYHYHNRYRVDTMRYTRASVIAHSQFISAPHCAEGRIRFDRTFNLSLPAVTTPDSNINGTSFVALEYECLGFSPVTRAVTVPVIRYS